MSIIKVIDPSIDFWKFYPEFNKIEEFKNLKKDYKNSSDVMWFIVNMFDLESKFVNLPLEDRAEVLGKDYLGNKNFYKTELSKIEASIEMFKKLNDSAIERHHRQLLDTMDKRTRFLKEQDYDLENYDKLDKMVTGTVGLLTALDKVKKSLEAEKGESTTKGNAIPSLADSEDI